MAGSDFYLFVPRLRRLSNSHGLLRGGGASLFIPQSLLRERGDPVSSQGNLPRECGLGKEPFFFHSPDACRAVCHPLPQPPDATLRLSCFTHPCDRPPPYSPQLLEAAPLLCLTSCPELLLSCRTPHCSAVTSSITPHRPLHSTSTPLLILPHPSFSPCPTPSLPHVLLPLRLPSPLVGGLDLCLPLFAPSSCLYLPCIAPSTLPLQI